MPQQKGRWGCSKDTSFSVSIAVTEEGSMDNNIWTYYCKEVIAKCYPRSADNDESRVIIRTDAGPGRFNKENLADCPADGIYLFLGLPNGTEFQDMDNAFSPFQAPLKTNREDLHRARYNIVGSDAKVTETDLPHLIFGGNVSLPNGDTLELKNAFCIGLRPAVLKAARGKCGYIPSTRAPLKYGKLCPVLTTDDILSEDDAGVDALDNDSEEASTKIFLLKMMLLMSLLQWHTPKALGLKRTNNRARAFVSHGIENAVQITVPGIDRTPESFAALQNIRGIFQSYEWRQCCEL